MKKIDKIIKELSDLYEFNRKIKAFEMNEKRTATRPPREGAATDRRASYCR